VSVNVFENLKWQDYLPQRLLYFLCLQTFCERCVIDRREKRKSKVSRSGDRMRGRLACGTGEHAKACPGIVKSRF
jgi:hypothetical protein